MTIIYRHGRYFAAHDEAGKYSIFGTANHRPGNAPGSGSTFCLAHADTEAGAKYQVDAYAGLRKFMQQEFSMIEGNRK